MLAARSFEERQPRPEEAGVAIHTVKREGLKLLPALRAALGGESLSASARTPGRNPTPGATLAGPKARAVASGALGALVPEAPDQLGVPNLRVGDAIWSLLSYTCLDGSHVAPFDS